MATSLKIGQWGYSTDEEVYYGSFPTREEAAAEVIREYGGGWVGQYIDSDPERFLSADQIFDHILEQDVFGFEVFAGMFECSKEQERELEHSLRDVMREWRSKYSIGVLSVENTARVDASTPTGKGS